MTEIDRIVARTAAIIKEERRLRKCPTVDMFHALVMRMQESYPDWRIGQTYFNALADTRPDLTKNVRGTQLDPFYDDSRVPEFMAFVTNTWDVWDDEVRDWYKKWDGWHTES